MVAEALAAAPEGVDTDAWERACDAVRAYCGWHIAPSMGEDVVLDGSGTPVVMLPTLHLTALADVTDDGTVVDSPEWSAAGMVRKSTYGYWSHKFRSFTATMTHGYAECPGELLGVIAEAASRGVAGVAATQVGQVRIESGSGSAGFMLDQKAVLDRYRIPGVR